MSHFVNSFLTERIRDRAQYFMFVHELMDAVCLNASAKKNFIRAGIPPILVQLVANSVDKSVGKEQRLAGYMLVTSIFTAFTELDKDSSMIIISLLKKVRALFENGTESQFRAVMIALKLFDAVVLVASPSF